MAAAVPTAVALGEGTGAGVRRAGVASFVMKVILFIYLWILVVYIVSFSYIL